jgi:DinB superfamily
VSAAETWPEPPGSTLGDLERMLTATPAMVWAELQGMSDALRRWRPAPGEWCALEVVGHLTETDLRAFINRIVLVRSEPGAAFELWDPDAVEAARRDDVKTAEDVLDEFARVRAVGVGVVRELTPDDLRLAGRHPIVGELTVANLLAEWVAHDRAHLEQIGRIVRAAMLPGMGNAVEFGHVQEVVAGRDDRFRTSG